MKFLRVSNRCLLLLVLAVAPSGFSSAQNLNEVYKSNQNYASELANKCAIDWERSQYQRPKSKDPDRFYVTGDKFVRTKYDWNGCYYFSDQGRNRQLYPLNKNILSDRADGAGCPSGFRYKSFYTVEGNSLVLYYQVCGGSIERIVMGIRR
jgi:hypothetical protein